MLCLPEAHLPWLLSLLPDWIPMSISHLFNLLAAINSLSNCLFSLADLPQDCYNIAGKKYVLKKTMKPTIILNRTMADLYMSLRKRKCHFQGLKAFDLVK